MSSPQQVGSVTALIPLYNPGPSAVEAIRSVACQVGAVILVDDGSTTDVRAFVDGLGITSSRLLTNDRNRGIAHALNRGVTLSRSRAAAEYVLTVDQDSVLERGYVQNAVGAAEALAAASTAFAAIAAGTVNGRTTRGRRRQGLPFAVTCETIQSGMLFPVGTLRSLGPFDESLFIDCVDTDYILRGWRRGLPTVLVPDCRMQHALGEGIPVRLPILSRRRDYRIPYHPPLRRYYIARNRLRLMRRHFSHSPRWAIRQSYEQVKYTLLDLAWGPDKRRQLVALRAGLIHGLTGKGGPIPRRVRSALGH